MRTSRVASTTRQNVMAWAVALLYPVALALLLRGPGAADAAGIVHAAGAWLATILIIGVLRRAPWLALAITLSGATAVALLGNDEDPGRFLAFLAVDAVVGYLVATQPRRSWIASVAISSAWQCVVIVGLTSGDGLVGAMIALLAIAACGMAGLLFRQRREHAATLQSRAVIEAVTADRLRIARELHDLVAHSIGVVAIQAGAGSRVIETRPADAREALRVIESTSRETLTALRRTLTALRRTESAAWEPAPSWPAPGLADIARLVATTEAAGVRVDVRWAGERRSLPPDADLCGYRIVQEALTNVVRHAGTTDCQVAIDYGEDELTVEVVDEGRGRPGGGEAPGFGIIGMRERVSLLQGEFCAGPRPEGGFRVRARLPLPEPATAGAHAR